MRQERHSDYELLDLSVEADDQLRVQGFEVNESSYTDDNVTEELSDVEPLFRKDEHGTGNAICEFNGATRRGAGSYDLYPRTPARGSDS